ncbi:MAG: phosphatase PAP2 family protein [Bacteroidota bacterium]
MRFNPAEAATIAYLTFTFLFICFASTVLQGVWFHLLLRIGFVAVLLTLIYFSARFPNRITAFLRSFYPLILLGYIYGETDFMKNVIFASFDPYIVYAESFIFGLQPSLVFSTLFPQKWFCEILNFAYFSFYILIFMTCFYAYVKNPETFKKTIFTVMSCFFMYYTFFIFFPSEGPYYYFGLTPSDIHGSWFFSGAVKLAQDIGEKPTGAFPSSHVGISLILLIIGWKQGKMLFYTMLPVVFFLILATVYIKAHYALDVIGGFITAPIFFAISNAIYKRVFAKQETEKTATKGQFEDLKI